MGQACGHGSTTPNKLGVILVKRPKFLHSPAQVAGPCRLPFLAMILKPDDCNVTKVLHIAHRFKITKRYTHTSLNLKPLYLNGFSKY